MLNNIDKKNIFNLIIIFFLWLLYKYEYALDTVISISLNI